MTLEPVSVPLGGRMTNKFDEEQSGRVKMVRTKPRRSYHELPLKRKKNKPNRDQRTDKRGEE